MAYNNFDEYNTEAAYKDANTSAKEWAKLAKAKGLTRADALNAATPSWKNSKYMQGALDEVFGKETPTAVTETPGEETTTEQTQKEKPMSANAQQFQIGIDESNETVNKAVKNEYEQAKEDNKVADENVSENAKTHKSQMEELTPDYWEDSVPTSLFQYYKKDGLGEAGSKDAKIRLGYLIVNNLASGLKQMSNNFAAAAGRSPVFTDTESDWSKIKRTNLEEGLKRANEKKAATMQEITSLISANTNNKQKAIEVAREFGENTRLQRAFNAVSQQQKVDVLNARIMLGDYLGKQNKAQFTNYLLGHLEDGGDVKSAATMFLAKYGTDAIKDFLKNGGSIDDILTGTAGIGGGSSDKVYVDSNGKSYNIKDLSKQTVEELREDLDQQYLDGNITADEFIEKGKVFKEFLGYNPQSRLNNLNKLAKKELNKQLRAELHSAVGNEEVQKAILSKYERKAKHYGLTLKDIS